MKSKNEYVAAFRHGMVKVNLAFKSFMRNKFKENNIDITFEMLQVLRFLWKKDGVNQQEIADTIIKDKSSLTYLIDNLARRELVQRTEDSHDRRNKIITLTEQGHQLKDVINPWLEEMYQVAAKDVPYELLESAISLFENIHQNFERTQK